MICLVVALFSTVTMAMASADSVSLKAVKTVRTPSGIEFHLQFNESLVGQRTTESFINKTIQVEIPGAVVENGKRHEVVDHPEIKSLFIYNPNPSELRARLILKSKKAEEMTGHFAIDRTENTLKLVWSDQPKKGSIVNVEPVSLPDTNSGSVAGSEQPDPKSIEAEAMALIEENEENIPILSKKDKGTVESKTASSSSDLLVKGLSLILLLGALGFVGIRTYSHKIKMQNRATAIKVLTQHHLSPKRSLMIVQVAGESILLGVTDNSITHLKTLALLDEEIPEVEGSAKPDFERSLDKADEEFSFHGLQSSIRQKISKMKDFRA